jgi:hypothetical protein
MPSDRTLVLQTAVHEGYAETWSSSHPGTIGLTDSAAVLRQTGSLANEEAAMWRIVMGIVAALVTFGAADAQQNPFEPAWIKDKNGCRVRNANPQPNESVAWSGACPDGVAGGRGVLQWYLNGKPNGRYEGELRNGRATGHGVSVAANGDRYDGEWRDGLQNGHGVFEDSRGHYDGEWKDGRPNGHGTSVAANGNSYDGEWKDGRPNGHGVSVETNGDRYEGEWRDGRANGYGTDRNAKGETFSGNWVSGCFRDGKRRAAVGVRLADCQ